VVRKFRYHAAITIAAVVAFFGTVPLATSRVYLLPLILVPVAVGVWSWRAGTDLTPRGLRLRALLGSRFVPWSNVAAVVPADERSVYLVLTTGRRVRLPAVRAADAPKITPTGAAPEPATAQTEPAQTEPAQ
jgi:hypothetical protein